jgi:16S rRNA (cytosine967-C5)-methyltransferase
MRDRWTASSLAERRQTAPRSPRHPAGAEPRAAAALALFGVRQRGKSLTRVLEHTRLSSQAPAERALTQEMVYGSLRTLPRLEALVSRLLNHPMKPSDKDLESLILIGLYQLIAMGTPEHAAVAATVEAARLLGKPDKAALVNALLRRFLRERETLLAEVDQEPAVRWLFPEWLLESLRSDWPDDWEQIVQASNERAPMSLRVNRMRIDRRAYTARLVAAGITARPTPDAEMGLTLDQPRPTRDLPGFDEGEVSVQDGGAQLAAELLGAESGQRVLDACAAPGGKAAGILERSDNRLALVAIDSSPTRLHSIRETLSRLSLTAEVILADAAEPRGDWTRLPFDRILLDVPCSATGVIRRHPDIKWLRRATDITSLCSLQSKILDAAWPMLRTGGRLLYVTCSLLADENQHQISAFLERHPDARERPIDAPWGRAMPIGRQLLPTVGANDGFYYAVIEKVK